MREGDLCACEFDARIYGGQGVNLMPETVGCSALNISACAFAVGRAGKVVRA